MAFPQIETGYKPEFGLGAVYQGFNAANADQSAELNLIKQFLDNQRNQNEQPIDLATKQQNFDINNFKTTDGYQAGMRQVAEGQGKTTLAAGQTAEGLQPFDMAARRGALENEAGQNRNQARIQEIDDILNNPEVRFDGTTKQQLIDARASLVNRFKETPKFAGQRELKETGTESNEYIAELKAGLARDVAALKGGGVKDPKTAEEAIIRQIAIYEASGKFTHEEAQAERAKVYNAKNATKVQPGLTLAPGTGGGALVEKQPQVNYAPSTPTGQASAPAPTLEAQVKASGIAYEPETYEYRVVDGKVQRKKKGN